MEPVKRTLRSGKVVLKDGARFQVSGPAAEADRLRDIIAQCKGQKVGGGLASPQ